MVSFFPCRFTYVGGYFNISIEKPSSFPSCPSISPFSYFFLTSVQIIFLVLLLEYHGNPTGRNQKVVVASELVLEDIIRYQQRHIQGRSDVGEACCGYFSSEGGE